MMLTLYKIKCHIIASLFSVFYRVIYNKRLSIGSHVTWRKRFNLIISNDAYVSIADNCFFNNDCSINAISRIEIGEGTIFGENVKIYDHNHRFRDKNCDIKSQGFSSAPVFIGKHCWLGSNVVVLKGSQIGDHCVIGAGVVVRGTIPDNTIVKQGEICIETAEIR